MSQRINWVGPARRFRASPAPHGPGLWQVVDPDACGKIIAYAQTPEEAEQQASRNWLARQNPPGRIS